MTPERIKYLHLIERIREQQIPLEIIISQTVPNANARDQRTGALRVR